MLTKTGLKPVAFDDGIIFYGGIEHTFRPVTAAGAGGFWMSEYRDLSLTLFDKDGEKLDSLAFLGDWMGVEPRNARAWEDLIDTEPAVLGISEDASGMMWILCGVPPEEFPEFRGDPEKIPFGEVDVEDLGYQLLSVFHPERRDAPRSTRRLSFFSQGLLPGGLGFFGKENESGEVTIAVARLRLTHQGGS